MLSPFEWWCRNFILPDICKPCLFVFLRNLFYLTASTGVSVYVDGQLLGSIGPGGSVSASLEAPSCLVRVECGVYSRELILGQDSALQVSWGLNPPEMIVSHAKK